MNIDELSIIRLAICKSCPLYKEVNGSSYCNDKLYLNKDNGEYSITPKEGYKKGCGCWLQVKTRKESSKCPVGKW